MTIDAAWSVAGIVEELCRRAGIPRCNVDFVSGFADGFSTSNEQPASEAVRDLADVFLFDLSAHGGTLHFIGRAAEPVWHLTRAQLLEAPKEKKRRESRRVPALLQLAYFDVDGGLVADVQTSDRIADERTRDTRKIDTQVLMDADRAAQTVVILHKVALEEARGEVSFVLPDCHIALVPADVITLDGTRLRIVSAELEGGQQRIKAVYDRQSAYSSHIRGIPRSVGSPPPEQVVSDTLFHAFAAPPLMDADDRAGFYLAVTPAATNWSGAVVELSRDGVNFTESEDATAYATFGVTTAPLPFHRHEYRDDVHTLKVAPIWHCWQRRRPRCKTASTWRWSAMN